MAEASVLHPSPIVEVAERSLDDAGVEGAVVEVPISRSV